LTYLSLIMDFLAAEIASKKAVLASASGSSSKGVKKRKKYMTNGAIRRKEDELEDLRESSKRPKKQASEKEREMSSSTTDNVQKERKERSSSVSISDQLELERLKKSGSNLPSIQRKLRVLNLPVRLFGESVEAVFLRLIALERKKAHEGADEFALGRGGGGRNVFLGGDEGGFSKAYVVGGEEIGGGEGNGKASGKGKKGEEKEEEEMEGEENDAHKEIYNYFKGLLKQWAKVRPSKKRSDEQRLESQRQ